MKLRYNKKTILHYVLLYLAIISNGAIIESLNRSVVSIIIFSISIIVILIYRIKISKKILILSIILLADIFLVRIINNGGIGVDLYISIMAKILITYVCFMLDYKKIYNRYIIVVFIISLISLIFYFLSFISPDFLKIILGKPYEYFDNRAMFYGKLFYTFQEGGETRNCGFYSEPGLFQILQISSIYIILFLKNKIFLSKRKISIFLIIIIFTLVTTQSATGYLSLIVLIVPVLLMKKSKFKRHVTMLFILIILAASVDFVVNEDKSIVNNYLLIKINDLGSSEGDNLKTGDARLAIVQISLNIIRTHPFGIGVDGFSQYKILSGLLSGAGGGLFYFLAVLGYLGWVSILYYFVYYSYINRTNNSTFIIKILVFLLYTSAQPYILIPSLLFIADITDKKYITKELNHA